MTKLQTLIYLQGYLSKEAFDFNPFGDRKGRAQDAKANARTAKINAAEAKSNRQSYLTANDLGLQDALANRATNKGVYGQMTAAANAKAAQTPAPTPAASPEPMQDPAITRAQQVAAAKKMSPYMRGSTMPRAQQLNQAAPTVAQATPTATPKTVVDPNPMNTGNVGEKQRTALLQEEQPNMNRLAIQTKAPAMPQYPRKNVVPTSPRPTRAQAAALKGEVASIKAAQTAQTQQPAATPSFRPVAAVPQGRAAYTASNKDDMGQIRAGTATMNPEWLKRPSGDFSNSQKRRDLIRNQLVALQRGKRTPDINQVAKNTGVNLLLPAL